VFVANTYQRTDGPLESGKTKKFVGGDASGFVENDDCVFPRLAADIKPVENIC
jgi:hypothetical protein